MIHFFSKSRIMSGITIVAGAFFVVWLWSAIRDRNIFGLRDKLVEKEILVGPPKTTTGTTQPKTTIPPTVTTTPNFSVRTTPSLNEGTGTPTQVTVQRGSTSQIVDAVVGVEHGVVRLPHHSTTPPPVVNLPHTSTTPPPVVTLPHVVAEVAPEPPRGPIKTTPVQPVNVRMTDRLPWERGRERQEVIQALIADKARVRGIPRDKVNSFPEVASVGGLDNYLRLQKERLQRAKTQPVVYASETHHTHIGSSGFGSGGGADTSGQAFIAW